MRRSYCDDTSGGAAQAALPFVLRMLRVSRAVVLAVLALALLTVQQTTDVAADTQVEQLVIKSARSKAALTYSIEVARTPHQKAMGLMFRRELQPFKGMLFPYEGEQPVSMWMKNTYIPLDMLFIKKNGEILRIEAMTEPFSERIVNSGGPVTGVLEIAGGEARRLGIEPGDVVSHPHFAK